MGLFVIMFTPQPIAPQSPLQPPSVNPISNDSRCGRLRGLHSCVILILRQRMSFELPQRARSPLGLARALNVGSSIASG